MSNASTIKQSHFTTPLEHARQVLAIESRAIEQLASQLDASFNIAAEFILQCKGRIVVSGIGKSGHIGRKIAATFASTGSPSFFMHPAEASHGDLGMITSDDVVIAISNSGASDELVVLLPMIKRMGAKLIGITGNPQSAIGLASDVHLDAHVEKEACPLGLAPTASTTVALALGDALAVAVLEMRGFSADDFARSHPGGSLGRRLLIKIADVMRQHPHVPFVSLDATLAEGLLEMSAKGVGMTAIVDKNHHILGIFTDGDLRRTLARNLDFSTTKIRDVMTANPLFISGDKLATEAVELMEKHRINALLVTDNHGRLIGALNMLDLLAAKVV